MNQRLQALTDEGSANLLRFMKLRSTNWRFLIPQLKNPRDIDWKAVRLWQILLLTSTALAIPLLAVIVPSAPHTIQSFEGLGYNVAYTVLVFLMVGMLLWDTFRLSRIWLELRVLLMALDRLPLRRGFARMKGFKSRRLWELGGNTLEDFFLVLSREIQTMSALGNADHLTAEMRGVVTRVQSAVAEFSKWLSASDQSSAKFDNVLVSRLWGLQDTLARACATTLRDLNYQWSLEKQSVFDMEGATGEKSETGSKEDDVPLPVRLAEDFACLFYFNFISSVFTRMRALLLTIAGLYVFILLSFSSYPFEPSSAFHTAMIFLLIFIVAAAAVVYAQAHKNATISRITDTKPGELGGEFWLRLAGFVSVPLLTLIATKFPEIGGFLFSWLEPASQAFR